MKTLSGARVYDIRQRLDSETGETTYYAQTHCTCGSTLSSGEWFPSMRRAVAEARASIENHCKQWHAEQGVKA